ncbi:DUF6301 family protein [Nocardia anaemiae]|uniref:DUF6301 family protein n=1 Tax=Nocardia anaemiae TaxID=263910 RepID=UPI0007A3F50B|nr:DUF6301 family protein [Nocardia anaemiae]
MVRWRALTDDEIVELRSLDWSWQLQDVPSIGERFDWYVLMTLADWVMLDCDIGLSSVAVTGRDWVVESMVTDSASAVATGLVEIRWAFPETTVRLRNLSLAHTVQLTYQTNISLAALDRSTEFERQGLT